MDSFGVKRIFDALVGLKYDDTAKRAFSSANQPTWIKKERD